MYKVYSHICIYIHGKELKLLYLVREGWLRVQASDLVDLDNLDTFMRTHIWRGIVSPSGSSMYTTAAFTLYDLTS